MRGGFFKVPQLGRPDLFFTNLPDTFFGILGVCMSGPEEDLDQGGRFLWW